MSCEALPESVRGHRRYVLRQSADTDVSREVGVREHHGREETSLRIDSRITDRSTSAARDPDCLGR